MKDRISDTSLLNLEMTDALKLWKKWPDSPIAVNEMKKVLNEVVERGVTEITIRKEAVREPGKFRTRELAMQYGQISGSHIVFEVKPQNSRKVEEGKLNVRVDSQKGMSYLVLETPADKAFGFLRPEDIVSIKI